MVPVLIFVCAATTVANNRVTNRQILNPLAHRAKEQSKGLRMIFSCRFDPIFDQIVYLELVETTSEASHLSERFSNMSMISFLTLEHVREFCGNHDGPVCCYYFSDKNVSGSRSASSNRATYRPTCRPSINAW